MKVLVIADRALKEELEPGAVGGDMHVEWATDGSNIKSANGFDACMDLHFENNKERIQLLKGLQVPLIIINDVAATLKDIREDFIRINGWATFLKRPVVEATCNDESQKEIAEKIFSGFGKKIEWVPDIPGFITSRVVASVINEAYFTLEGEVSTKKEIDIAMKLGTNYPYGPFEWSEKIGLRNIYALLSKLADEQKRYEPASLLTKEALA